MNITFHKNAALGHWSDFSLEEQLGNIGSEVARAATWQGKDEKNFQGAVDRALELFDLTLEDPRWKGRLFEVARARELFCAASLGHEEYNTSLADLNNYFLFFALAARAHTFA